MIDIEWHELAAVSVGCIAIGGTVVALLRGFFQTKKGCDMGQQTCQKTICAKLDTLGRVVVDDRKLASDHYAEIKGMLGKINGKLNGGRRESDVNVEAS